MANPRKIKILDTFWKEFEKYVPKLRKLDEEIKQQEKNVFLKYEE